MTDLLIVTLVWGGQLALITIGLSLSYAILRFVNFAHMEFVTVGAFLAHWVNVDLGLPLLLAGLVAMFGTGIVAVATDRLIFRYLQGASVAALMLASVGVAIVLRMGVQTIWGSRGRMFGMIANPNFEIGNVGVTDVQLLIVGSSAVSVLVFYVLLQRTKLGRMLRATADNFDLATARGINAPRAIAWTWFISGAFAALGGALLGIETMVRPTMGLAILLPMFAAAVIGGFGSAHGAVVGALILSLAQNALLQIDFGWFVRAEAWFIAPAYKSSIALAFLVLILLVKPSGLFARFEARA